MRLEQLEVSVKLDSSDISERPPKDYWLRLTRHSCPHLKAMPWMQLDGSRCMHCMGPFGVPRPPPPPPIMWFLCT